MFLNRYILNITVKVALTALTFLITYLFFTDQPEIFLLFPIVAGVRMFCSIFLYYDYKLAWSLATIRTAYHKGIIGIISFVIYTPFMYFYFDTPIKGLVLEWILYHFVTFLMVYNYAHYQRRKNSDHKVKDRRKSIVIYGAGVAGVKIGHELSQRGDIIRFYIDDSTKKQKRSINGHPVLSVDKAISTIEGGVQPDLLIFAMPMSKYPDLDKKIKQLKPYFKKLKILPSIFALHDNETYFQQVKNIGVEELLARHPKVLDTQKITNFIKGKCILVTGAGGSIGSELAEQCLRYEAGLIIHLDHSEIKIYELEEKKHGKQQTAFVLQSVYDKIGLEQVFKKYRPEVVLHAAAYKHVPICEHNKEAAILNNIIGTKNCIDLSIQYEVEKFVLVSTDKAVRPTNVMGATKRVCELYGQNSNERGKTDIVAVRFGNVLGSSGSVIPRFKKLVKQNKNLTVTHPEITRYFMLIPEACQLVLQAASIASGGEIFILDMGEPVKIYDLAEKFLELSGRTDLGIDITGLRPGEKLYEELMLEGTEKPTEYADIFIARRTHYNIEQLEKDIEELLLTDDKVAGLKTIVHEFKHEPHGQRDISVAPTTQQSPVQSATLNKNDIIAEAKIAS